MCVEFDAVRVASCDVTCRYSAREESQCVTKYLAPEAFTKLKTGKVHFKTGHEDPEGE